MRSGLCSFCKNVLTLENSKPSVFKKRAGYCRSCARIKRGPGRCHACKEIFSESNSNPSTLKIGRGKCRICENLEYQKVAEKVKERAEKWAAKNSVKHKQFCRSWYRKKKYGITREEFEAQFNLQRGLCSICKEPMITSGKPRGKRVCQDHNHETGKLRDLLCSSCNLLLGNSYENEKILVNAILYLRKHADGSSIQTVCDGVQNISVAS